MLSLDKKIVIKDGTQQKSDICTFAGSTSCINSPSFSMGYWVSRFFQQGVSNGKIRIKYTSLVLFFSSSALSSLPHPVSSQQEWPDRLPTPGLRSSIAPVTSLWAPGTSLWLLLSLV